MVSTLFNHFAQNLIFIIILVESSLTPRVEGSIGENDPAKVSIFTFGKVQFVGELVLIFCKVSPGLDIPCGLAVGFKDSLLLLPVFLGPQAIASAREVERLL